MKKRKRKLRRADVPIFLGSLVVLLVVACVCWGALLIQQVVASGSAISLQQQETTSLHRSSSANNSSSTSSSPTSGATAKMNYPLGFVDSTTFRLVSPASNQPQAIQPPYSSLKLLHINPPLEKPSTCKNDTSSQHQPTIRVYRRQSLNSIQVPQAEPDFGPHRASTRSNFHLFYPIIDPIHRTQFIHTRNNNITTSTPTPSTLNHLKNSVNSQQQQQQQLVDVVNVSKDGEQELAEWTNSTRPEGACHNASYVEYSRTDDSHKYLQSTSANSTDFLTTSLGTQKELTGVHKLFKTITNSSSSSSRQEPSLVERAPSSQTKASQQQSNVIESEMVTNRSQVSLVCNAHDMLVKFKFRQPFRGLVISDLSRMRSCHLVGSGALYYEMRIPLNDCGTRQGNPRLFLNNIQIQFRNLLDAEGEDEIKTLICSYPIQPPILVRPQLVPSSMVTSKPGSVLSERIIEADTGGRDKEPSAALVYYEPLVLIASLLLLALTLLGLTTSAYLLVRRTRRRTDRLPREATTYAGSRFLQQGGSASFGTTTQLTRPPLVSSTRGDAGIQMMPSPNFRRHSARHRPLKRPNHKQHVTNNKQHSSDSLAALNENSSVTTIEVPFTPAMQRDEKSTEQASKLTDNLGSSSRDVETPAHHINVKNLKDQPKERALSRRKRAYKQPEIGQVNRETQIDSETPTFGSLRASLTSPQEFKRLQEIVRMFDQIHIENCIERGNNKSPLVYNTTRLNPSKYKNRILDVMSKEERELISQLLRDDELFRSQVVECTKVDRFNRKLRNSHQYSHLLSPEAWDLLAEILLDSELHNEPENNLNHSLEARLNVQQQDESMVGQVDAAENRLISSNLSSITQKDSLESDHGHTTFNSDSKLSIGKEFRSQ